MSPDWTSAIEHFSNWQTAACHSPGTVRMKRHYLRAVARGHDDPWTVTTDDLTAWIAAEASWGPETRKSARSAVLTFYRWAQQTGRVDHSPAELLSPVRIPRALPRPAPREAIVAALTISNDCVRLMILLGSLAGLRAGEIAAFHPSRDVVDGIIRVRGKGGAERQIPMHPVLATELEREMQRRRAGSPGTGWRFNTAEATVDGWLFPGMSGGHLTANPVSKQVSAALGEGLSAHQLRHYFASETYAVKQDLRAVQELLGHSKPETTARYTAVPPGALLAAVSGVDLQLPAAFPPASKRAGCPPWCDHDVDLTAPEDLAISMQHSRRLPSAAGGMKLELAQLFGWEPDGEPYTDVPWLFVGDHEVPATPENLRAFGADVWTSYLEARA